MGKLLRIITPLHKRTTRDYIGRMTDNKVEAMGVAKKYGRDYWDGDRRYGYGGYRYDGRWEKVARKLIRTYKLKKNARILDVGCGKAFLLYELKKLLPQSTIVGMDISRWGLSHAPKEIRKYLRVHRAEDTYPFKDWEFDLVISITTLHNLTIDKLAAALGEIERVGKHKYIAVESYRNDPEQFNLQCWALTCAAFFSKREWVWLYRHFGYTGDYEFIYFE
ncbi:SAM-dependent methyltransferase [Candidatus Gottesmanbacteria bacterium RBG_16_52_11]|uniref:SAM-dependent methyltransferase n=1 Tax=Candidatus Gottesmanbacteria bacterium RBG_16_52_11 TaxID=1798374 RepID=A0A1F5YW07_9BACT|nr:MAG: SAM-dependent methyltransferase [Candidatus Gottesmanbacteria bacterium RBG_16_52_11]